MMNRREFAKVGAAAFALSANANAAAWSDTNRRAAVTAVPLPPSSSLPQALIFDSGRPVENRAQWPRRREEILHTAAAQMYGTAPSSAGLHFVVKEKDGSAFGGKARRRQVQLHFKVGSSGPTANLLLYTPRHIPHAPVIVGLNFWGNHTLSDDPEVLLPTSWVESGRNIFADLSCVVDHRATPACRSIDAHRWPVEQLIDRGYALCTVYRGDIDADQADESIPGLRSAYPELSGRGDNFAAIGAWAWTLSRMLDYLETDPQIDPQRAAIFGWSRLGKAAVWAGACDSRFAAVLSQESGTGGAKLFRRGVGEDIHRLNTVFPHWFCKNFRSYIGMDRELPFDQHLILSAIAPRPLFVASAVDDTLSDPPGEFASASLASQVYRLLGVTALPSPTMLEPGAPLIGRVSYQIRTGGHDVTSYDWDQYLHFLDRYV
jgi:hypothetical protein